MWVCRPLVQRLFYTGLLWLEISLRVFDLTSAHLLELLHSPLVSVIKSFLISLVREAVSLRKRRLPDLKCRMMITVRSVLFNHTQTMSALSGISGRPHGLRKWEEATAALLDQAVLGVVGIVVAREFWYGSFVELGHPFGVFSKARNTLRRSEIAFGWILWEQIICVEPFRSGVVFNLEESVPSDGLLLEINLGKMIGITNWLSTGVGLS